jgi:hypothetical protein
MRSGIGGDARRRLNACERFCKETGIAIAIIPMKKTEGAAEKSFAYV